MMGFPLEGLDYYVYLTKLPEGIYAMLLTNDDGTYSMYLDYRRDFEHRLNDWEHEIWHILRDDFYNGQPIQKVERI